MHSYTKTMTTTTTDLTSLGSQKKFADCSYQGMPKKYFPYRFPILRSQNSDWDQKDTELSYLIGHQLLFPTISGGNILRIRYCSINPPNDLRRKEEEKTENCLFSFGWICGSNKSGSKTKSQSIKREERNLLTIKTIPS